MKKLLAVVAVIAVVAALAVWILSWFRTPEVVATSVARPWPGGLGPLNAVAGRFEPLPANEASAKLKALVAALPKNDAIEEFVSREIGRNELKIGTPPALPDLSAIRDLLLSEPVVWERRAGIDHPDTFAMRTIHMTVARSLVATALARAREGDAGAWEELHALWKLTGALDTHPQLMARTAAMTSSRLINAVAWRMPLPPPAWFAEVQQRDHVQPLLEAFQYSVDSYASDTARIFPTRWLADSVEHDRRIAETLFSTTRCDVSAPANDLGVDLSSIWRRTFRFRAEREATANAIRMREGKPIVTTSRCSDGNWQLAGTTLRFSREIPTSPPDSPMPLQLRIE